MCHLTRSEPSAVGDSTITLIDEPPSAYMGLKAVRSAMRKSARVSSVNSSAGSLASNPIMKRIVSDFFR
ncbi:hypothetical protein M407DRAFT_202584 [Tulasnella calospora MUT 4182]|uniref:Uncharacterized protein n=1 Tax=Tulasnella calospora MUT 4182 TaxID=1051891 RepID=A0A0C3Q8Q2_9AGAM|nr:hypothetical protein M407DRAFT_202584 [Tulasnella calospora MUT 4182]